MAAYNFPNSPSDGDTVTSNGITYTYSSSKTRWDGAAPSGSSTTVYATIDDLPLSGASTGDQAYVEGNNRLYIWNGTGWYNIALINTTPSISGASSSYDLATDGTATTVTITATDPEGIPITYSIASDTSGNVATVTQGTGSNTNVFTITPSTNTANAGTFSLTFRASDGVNIATAVSSFTLQFKVANSNYTTALITSVGANNAVNNSFTDSSTNSHTITANGNVTQGAFSPYRHGGYSIFCDGANVIDLGFSTLNSGNWTFECWALVETGSTILGKYGGGNQLESFGVSGTTGYMNTHTSVGGENPTCNTDLRDGKWHYLVWERYNGTYYYWADGSLEASFANSESPSATGNWVLGGVASSRFKGNIKEARFSLSTAVYSGSAPTTPTEPQTTSNATDAFFTGVGLEIKDYSSNNRSFTVPSTFESAPTTPYDHGTYSATDHGGSIYFDGSGDYLSVSGNTIFNFTSDDFTIEAWVYLNVMPTADNWPATWNGHAVVAGTGTPSASDGCCLIIGSNRLAVQSSDTAYWSTAHGMATNKWYHIAVSRSSGTLYFFVNGVSAGTATLSGNVGTGANTYIGSETGQGAYVNGYVTDIRVVKGTAVYTSDFTPPTAPLTAITNTSLLINGTNAGIIDKSQSVETITLNGDVKSSTTQSKFLTSSIYFDGTGDYLSFEADSSLAFGTGDFTIELWLYTNNAAANQTLIDFRPASTNGLYPLIYIPSGSTEDIRYHVDGANRITSSTISSNAWMHVAVARSGSSTKLFINGTQQGSTYTDSNNYALPSRVVIGAGSYSLGGAPLNGYISDVRITKGLARYTSNFTPPSAALQG